MENQQLYRSRAVRALVLLHDEHLRRFLVIWKRARATSVVLPETADPAYASLETRYRIDAMLEHAVMHPIRHAFQLDELMTKRG